MTILMHRPVFRHFTFYACSDVRPHVLSPLQLNGLRLNLSFKSKFVRASFYIKVVEIISFSSVDWDSITSRGRDPSLRHHVLR